MSPESPWAKTKNGVASCNYIWRMLRALGRGTSRGQGNANAWVGQRGKRKKRHNYGEHHHYHDVD
jgi:hypothetical protein